MKKQMMWAVAVASLALSGCGGREAHPVAAVSVHDNVLDCASITREFEANERQVLATLKEQGRGRGKNAFAVGASVIFLPALFFIDPKSPEKVEIDALRNRNTVLGEVARGKSCAQPKSQLKDVYQRLDKPSSASNEPKND